MSAGCTRLWFTAAMKACHDVTMLQQERPTEMDIYSAQRASGASGRTRRHTTVEIQLPRYLLGCNMSNGKGGASSGRIECLRPGWGNLAAFDNSGVTAFRVGGTRLARQCRRAVQTTEELHRFPGAVSSW